MKKVTLTIVHFFLLAMVAQATDLYVSPAGNGTTCTNNSPCTVAQALSVVVPGDHVKMLDGTYTGANGMINVPAGKNGTASQRIYVEAVNDGKVLIDGQGTLGPIVFSGQAYWTVQGMNAKHSGAEVIAVYGGSFLEFKRIVAWDANPANNTHCVGISSTNSPILVEDVAAFGTCRKTFSASQGGNYVTYRRIWGQWNYTDSNGGPKTSVELTYANSHLTVENSIFTWNQQDGSNLVGASGIMASTGFTNDADRRIYSQLYGNIVYLPAGRPFTPDFYFFQTYQDEIVIRDLAVFVTPDQSSKIPLYLGNCRVTPFSTSAECPTANLKASNISLIGGAASPIGSNWVQSNIVAGPTLGAVYPSGSLWSNNGAGATICFQYINGTLSTAPIFTGPGGTWPMNQRIIDAMTSAGKTPENVTASLESMFGPIPAKCKGTALPIDSPSNLRLSGITTF